MVGARVAGACQAAPQWSWNGRAPACNAIVACVSANRQDNFKTKRIFLRGDGAFVTDMIVHIELTP
jgi:hypothetical protein